MLGMIMTVVAIMIIPPNSRIGHPEGCGNYRTCSVSSDTDHGPNDLEWCLTHCRCRIYRHSDHRAYAGSQR
jgi:hypothetical protein